MNTKKYLLSALAGLVGFIVASIVLEDFILKSYLERTFYQPIGELIRASAHPEFSVPLPFVGFLVVWILIMAYMYPKGYEGGSPAFEGLRFGVLLGLFQGVPLAISFEFFFGIGLVPVLVQIFRTTLEVATAGLLIGLVNGRK